MNRIFRLATAVVLTLLSLVARGQVFSRGTISGTIFGKVLFAADNHPADHIRIQLLLPNGAWGPATYTGFGGEFDFESLPTSSYVVVVDEPGYEPIHASVDVDLGSRFVELRLTKNRAPAPEGPSYVISARDLSIPSKAREAFESGMLHLSRRDPTGGLPDFRRAITRFPAYYEAYYEIGMAELQLEHERDAEQAFRKAIEESDGRYAQAYVALGALLCDQGKFAEAEEITGKGVELDRGPWLGHYFLARAMFRLGRWADAEKSVHETIARNPELPEAYLLLSAIHLNQKNYIAVLDDLDEYMKVDPNSSTASRAKEIREKVRHAIAQGESSAPTPETGAAP